MSMSRTTPVMRERSVSPEMVAADLMSDMRIVFLAGTRQEVHLPMRQAKDFGRKQAVRRPKRWYSLGLFEVTQQD